MDSRQPGRGAWEGVTLSAIRMYVEGRPGQGWQRGAYVLTVPTRHNWT